jgi:hypothetical protein
LNGGGIRTIAVPQLLHVLQNRNARRLQRLRETLAFIHPILRRVDAQQVGRHLQAPPLLLNQVAALATEAPDEQPQLEQHVIPRRLLLPMADGRAVVRGQGQHGEVGPVQLLLQRFDVGLAQLERALVPDPGLDAAVLAEQVADLLGHLEVLGGRSDEHAHGRAHSRPPAAQFYSARFSHTGDMSSFPSSGSSRRAIW